MQMQILIGGIQKTSLLDYPGKISAIVFMNGCNFNCGYCHNPDLLYNTEGIYNTDAFFEFLTKRQGRLDGVVITGGEPTLQKDLIPFIKEIKSRGFLVKLDTNGHRPEILREALNYIDYAAMDIKSPLNKYSLITNCIINKDKILQSIQLLLNSQIDYEFRTTVIKSQLSYDDFKEIAILINGAKKYYLQKFEVSGKINDNNLIKETTYSNEEFEQIKRIMQPYIEKIEIR